MQDLPDQVKIFDITYQIIYVPEMYMVSDDGGELCEGSVNLEKHEIRIYKKDQSKAYLFNRILHEVLHAGLDGLCLDKKDWSKEERFIQGVATIVNTVLIDNNWLREDFLDK